MVMGALVVGGPIAPAGAQVCGRPQTWVDCGVERMEACLALDPLLIPDCVQTTSSQYCQDTFCGVVQHMYDQLIERLGPVFHSCVWEDVTTCL